MGSQLHNTHVELVQLHRRTGGEVLRGYGLRTRVLEYVDNDTGQYEAWGADYWPIRFPWNLPFQMQIFRQRDTKDELGIPAALPCEAWYGSARTAGKDQTAITRYEYNADTWNHLPHGEPRINETIVPLDITDVPLSYLRAGMGYDRRMPTEFEKTHDGQEFELLIALSGLLSKLQQ
jgi:hypothetical protein